MDLPPVHRPGLAIAELMVQPLLVETDERRGQSGLLCTIQNRPRSARGGEPTTLRRNGWSEIAAALHRSIELSLPTICAEWSR